MSSLDDVKQNTLAKCRQQIAKAAEDAFKNHQVVLEAEGRWLCKKPGTSIYSFRVVALPGAIVIYGDIGEAILRPSDRDVVGWLRGSVGSPDYVLGKMYPTPMSTFYPGDALTWAKEQAKEHESGRQLLRAALELAQWDELDEHSWGRVIRDADFPGECGSIGCGVQPQVLWLLEALAWFVRHESEAKLAAAQSLDEHNRGVASLTRNDHLAGVFCPVCKGEMVYTSPNVMLTSYPPKHAVHCPGCKYEGYKL